MRALVILFALMSGQAAARPTAAVRVPGVGEVEVLPARGGMERAVVLLSDAEGPDATARELAEALAAGGALVAVVDTRAVLAARGSARCAYPAGDLEALAQRVQKVQGVGAYERPVLVGHGQGAAVAWAALSQAPAGTFAGAVLVAPCAGEPLPLRLCPGSGPPARGLRGGELPSLDPPPGRSEIVAGGRDEICPAAAAAALARALQARYTVVPSANHELDEAAVGAVRAAAARFATDPSPATSPPSPVPDLPLVEVPSTSRDPRLVLLLSGDGGWVGIDKALAGAFAEAGVAVVGLDSLRYFWKRRTPEEAARDAARALAHYRRAWGRPDTLLVGYSRGADIVPIIAGLLPAEERARVRLVAMLGPSTFAELEVHAIDLLTSRKRAGALSTEAAVRATGGAMAMVCVHGTGEHDSLCPRIADLPWVKDILLPGGHHFDGGYAALARRILASVP